MIYFDNSATTQVLPEVLSTYNAVSEKIWGSPPSLIDMASQAFDLLDQSIAILMKFILQVVEQKEITGS